ncbi:hypothetical protein [Mesorhizobium sp.]|uniref:hypothetical protein n=1 Tax=Mesorhizobium sp. TaxID=1871066 RepID=UPI00257B4211|nr:hypothetical protein [Mesorhizobium sp.]
MGMLELRDFEDDLLAAEQTPNDIEDRFRRAGLGYIDDVLEALEWSRHQGILTRKIGNRPCLKKPGSTSCRA